MDLIELKEHISLIIIDYYSRWIEISHLQKTTSGSIVNNYKSVFLSLRVSDYCLHLYCYFHNVSDDMSSGFLQVLSNSGTFMELRTTSFIETTGGGYLV